MRHNFVVSFLLILATLEPRLLASPAPTSRYSVIQRIAGPPTSSWDYALVDSPARRLYVASDGILVLNLVTQTVGRLPVQGESLHGIALLGNGVMAVADGKKNKVQFFVGDTGATLFSIPTGPPPSSDGWRNPDALLVEPASGLLVAVNGDSGTLVLINVKARAIAAVVEVGGKLEFAAAIGKGQIAVNVASRNSVAIVDIAKRKLVREISLKNCESPTGLVYDYIDRLVISVCENGIAKFIDPELDAEVASRLVGKGADAILYDPVRRVAFATAGDDGTLSVIAIHGRKSIAVTQTINTQPGVRLGAIDPRTGRLYLPAVKYDRWAPPVILPGLPPMPAAVASTFEFLVVGRE